MNKTLTALILIGTFGVLMTVGCDLPPSPPRLKWRAVDTLQVNREDAQELAAATAMAEARVNYMFRLDILGLDRDLFSKPNHVLVSCQLKFQFRREYKPKLLPR